MSDDPRSYQSGKAKRDKIMIIGERLSKEGYDKEVRELWKKHAYIDFAGEIPYGLPKKPIKEKPVKKEEPKPKIKPKIKKKGAKVEHPETYHQRLKELKEDSDEYTSKEFAKKRTLSEIKKEMKNFLNYKTGDTFHRQPTEEGSLFKMTHKGGNEWDLYRGRRKIEENITINNYRDLYTYGSMGKNPLPSQWKIIRPGS